MNIKFEIVSRGQLVVIFENKKITLEGELTFTPSVFYVTLPKSLYWDDPHSSILVKVEELNEIKQFLTANTIGTRIVFDN